MILEKADQKSLIDNAKYVGEKLARQVRGEFNTDDPGEISDKLGIKIQESEKGNFGDLQIFSSYNHKSKTITTYKDSIAQSNGMDFLIAHELFHYFEDQNKMAFKFKGLSEVAAHSFACKLTGVKEKRFIIDLSTQPGI